MLGTYSVPNRLESVLRCDLAADDDECYGEQRDDDEEDHEEGSHVQPPLQAQLARVGQGLQAGLTGRLAADLGRGGVETSASCTSRRMR